MSFPRAANNRDASASYSLASTLTSLLSDAAAQRCEESTTTVNSSTGSSPRNHHSSPRGAGKEGNQTKWRQRKTPPHDLRRAAPVRESATSRARAELAALARREDERAAVAAGLRPSYDERAAAIHSAAAAALRPAAAEWAAAELRAALEEVEPGLVSEAARAARLELLTLAEVTNRELRSGEVAWAERAAAWEAEATAAAEAASPHRRPSKPSPPEWVAAMERRREAGARAGALRLKLMAAAAARAGHAPSATDLDAPEGFWEMVRGAWERSAAAEPPPTTPTTAAPSPERPRGFGAEEAMAC